MIGIVVEKIKRFFSGRNIYLIISFSVLIVLMVLGTLYFGPKLTDIAREPEEFREFVGSSGINSYLVFIGIQFVQIIFAFIPGEFVEIGAGYVFGAFKGTVLSLAGVFVATFFIFSLTRLLGRKFTEIMIDGKELKRLKFLQDEKKVTLLFCILYFVPGTPKDLITYFAGVTSISFWKFMAISTFFRIPSVLTSTIAGDALVDRNYWTSIIIFAVTGSVAVIGYFLYPYLSKRFSRIKEKYKDNKNQKDTNA